MIIVVYSPILKIFRYEKINHLLTYLLLQKAASELHRLHPTGHSIIKDVTEKIFASSMRT